MAQSRRLVVDEISKGLPQGYGYCRKCMKVKTEGNFSKATDLNLDKNGRLSLCKECVDEMYVSYLSLENGSIDKAVLALCKMLNIMYDPRAIESSLAHIRSKNSDPLKLFGLYRAKILVLNRENVSDTSIDLTYKEPVRYLNINEENHESLISNGNVDELKKFWGKKFNEEQLGVLEEKFALYMETNTISSPQERTLLKYLCLKEYDIDLELEKGGSTANLMKEHQSIMNGLGISPADISAANSGKAQETWGMFIKEIEQTEPAEKFKDDDLFKDYDNINHIWEKYVKRPIKNFITGSRDFNVEDIDADYEDESDEADTTPPLEYTPEE